MMDDVILNKKESIERCIQQIRTFYARESDSSFEEDWIKQDAIALNLQRGIQQCIDLANHVVRIKKLGIPKTSKDGFVLLAENGIIPRALLSPLAKMVGFRNILVHQYQKIEPAVLRSIIEQNLDDILALSDNVLKNG